MELTFLSVDCLMLDTSDTSPHIRTGEAPVQKLLYSRTGGSYNRSARFSIAIVLMTNLPRTCL